MYKSYTELMGFKTFEDRFNYLKTNGLVGDITFGPNRGLNQKFYASKEWKDFRRRIILRDNSRDLGCEGHEFGNNQPIYIHHINPISVEDVINRNFKSILNPDNVISCSFETHQAIHYGDINQLHKDPIERSPNDTCPWK